MMMKKRKICDTYTPGNVVSPVASSENYESDGSSMSCCSRNGSSNSKSLDLDVRPIIRVLLELNFLCFFFCMYKDIYGDYNVFKIGYISDKSVFEF